MCTVKVLVENFIAVIKTLGKNNNRLSWIQVHEDYLVGLDNNYYHKQLLLLLGSSN